MNNIIYRLDGEGDTAPTSTPTDGGETTDTPAEGGTEAAAKTCNCAQGDTNCAC